MVTLDFWLIALQLAKTALEIIKAALEIWRGCDDGKENPGKKNGSGPEA